VKGRVILKLSFYFLADKHRVVDIALVHFRQEFRKADFFFFLSVGAGFHHLPEQEGRDYNDRPENHRFHRRIHLKLLIKRNPEMQPETAAPSSPMKCTATHPELDAGGGISTGESQLLYSRPFAKKTGNQREVTEVTGQNGYGLVD
jgi:hypothetical protein